MHQLDLLEHLDRFPLPKTELLKERDRPHITRAATS